MRLGRGLIVKVAVGVVALGLVGFWASSIIRDKAEQEYERREAVAKEKYGGSGIKADITSAKVAFAVRKEGGYAASSGRLHVSRVDNYGFTDIVDIKLSLWNP